ncbi:hypothetical protein [Cellulomonas sp.]|uniref:hypothetical protein n=1 Tax=Cellulomonas sp. TaxID=40001 RepID=UPI002590C8E0|nr:hypothetical protein [Cellulomonas sp.]MCR6689090.1 hypothetical protein [Cellulomonas sp.]
MTEPTRPPVGARGPHDEAVTEHGRALQREIRADARHERRVVLVAALVAVLATAAVLVGLAALR